MLESEGSFRVSAVFGEAGRGARVGVEYRGCPGGNRYMLHELMSASARDREQFYGLSVVPWTALVGVVGHSPHWGGGQGGTGVIGTPGEGGNLTVCMAIVGMVSMVVG